MRATRLLSLLELLRQYRYPVSAQELANKLSVSIRTIYRDIATLKAQGALIDGEPNVGYRLLPGFVLPPMMFTQDELDALILGVRWVIARGDAHLSQSAKSGFGKIMAVLPEVFAQQTDINTLLVAPSQTPKVNAQMMLVLRHAIASQHKISIDYQDYEQKKSTRTIWPFAIDFLEQQPIVLSWCELRADFRHFRVDRIEHLNVLADQYPEKRADLLQRWLKQFNYQIEY
jgi:predicted DNA-binding transcriptional regulator YafY